MSRLTVPEKLRETAGKANVRRNVDGSLPSFTWIIEISSQILFSTSAAVHFELLLGRDEKSIDLGFSSLTGQSAATPGQLEDHQQSKRSKDGHHSAAQPKGVFSHAIRLVVDDTISLWNKPALPEWNDEGKDRAEKKPPAQPGEECGFLGHGEYRAAQSTERTSKDMKSRKRKRVHLVVLTHGLHSNLGSDMLYLKESIDAAAKQAREDARNRKRKLKARESSTKPNREDVATSKSEDGDKATADSSTAPLSGGQDAPGPENDSDDDEEEVVVRGFPGNATRTERGIQYLGKRLAKWVLAMTYPDQEYLPVKKSVRKKISRVLTGDGPSPGKDKEGPSPHKHSSIHRPGKKPDNLAYKITSISFIAHSLGGLTQTYAIAYIHKHSPHFFGEIKPINFVTMAAPFLGLSNENPLYVKFALDFGLVGRTGQDLGLAWRAPNMVRSGWGAMIGGIGIENQRAQRHPDPGSKPLLRILPTGHTHQVLKLFRNRTVYSNVVNDGIVPLRTSCLLFLDWSGLGRVEKARRENFPMSMATWGWREMIGTNASAKGYLNVEHEADVWSQSDVSGDEGGKSSTKKTEVPQPEENAVRDDNTAEGKDASKAKQDAESQAKPFQDEDFDANKARSSSPQQPSHPLSGFLSFLRPTSPKAHHHAPKQKKIYSRSQTIRPEASGASSPSSESIPESTNSASSPRPGRVRGDSVMEDPNNVFAPPKTTIFEAAGDVLNPPLPSKSFLVDPKSRPRTIFHDRVYHPEDIPPPPTKKRPTLTRSISSELRNGTAKTNTTASNADQPDTSGMKVEEKIARAYHHGLSWRKVLVRLEPDAHNNMVVRRMFSNAYGWPVVKHLVDTHFADTYSARTEDFLEPNDERAKPMKEAVGEHGEEVDTNPQQHITRSQSEVHEATDAVSDLQNSVKGGSSMSSSVNRPSIVSRQDSAQWDDALFDVTDDEDDIEHSFGMRLERRASPSGIADDGGEAGTKGTSEAEIAKFLHREPGRLETSDGDADGPKVTSAFTASPTAASPRSATSVGLGKSLEERLSTPGRHRRVDDNEEGLADDVARVGIDDTA